MHRIQATRAFAVFLVLVCVQPAAAEEAAPDWENPAVFARNTEPPHATFVPFVDEQAALANRVSDSPWYRSLNGPWKFRWSKTIDKRPKNFYQPSFDVSGWAEIDVPSNWEFARLRHPDLHEQPVSPSAQPAEDRPTVAAGRLVSPHVRAAGRLVGPPGVHSLRRRDECMLRLDQRRDGRLPRRQHDAGRVQHHEVF